VIHKKVFIFALLAALLVLSQSAYALPITAFGNVGYGNLKWTAEDYEAEDYEKITEASPALALQAGLVYELANGFGVGGIFDHVDVNQTWHDVATWDGGEQTWDDQFRYVLSGFGALVSYKVPVSAVDCDVFAGAVRYTFKHTELWATDGWEDVKNVTRDPAIGFIGGANLRAPLWNSLNLTGSFAYRSVSFDEGKAEWSDDGPVAMNGDYTEWPAQVNGWSATVGIAYKF
jgi:hypothetical protein